MKKPLIIHYHIFKNAGSTIDYILKRNFKEEARQLDEISKPRIVLQNRRLVDFLSRNSETKAISSHQLRFPIPKHQDWEFLPLIFIRHPIDRAFSIYHFKKKDISLDEYGLIAKKLDVKEFIRFNLESDYRVMKDFQTLFLSHRDNVSNTNDLDLEIAFFTLTQTHFGIVDRMDESLTLIEEELKRYFPSIDLSYIKKNVSTERSAILSERLASDYKYIDDDLMNSLIDNNNLDLSLYQQANKDLQHRLDKIDNFKDKLENFKHRCKQIEKSETETHNQ